MDVIIFRITRQGKQKKTQNQFFRKEFHVKMVLHFGFLYTNHFFALVIVQIIIYNTFKTTFENVHTELSIIFLSFLLS